MKKKNNARAYAYLMPMLISILVVTCLPIVYTVIISFTNYNMYHLNDFTFVGLENYMTVFAGSIRKVFFRCLAGLSASPYSVRPVPMQWGFSGSPFK